MRSAWNGVIAEMVGTFLFFFVGIGAIGALQFVNSGNIPSIRRRAWSSSRSPTASRWPSWSARSARSAAPTSIRPSLLRVWVAGQIPWRRGLAYVLAQLIGAILAAWLVWAVIPDEAFARTSASRACSAASPRSRAWSSRRC